MSYTSRKRAPVNIMVGSSKNHVNCTGEKSPETYSKRILPALKSPINTNVPSESFNTNSYVTTTFNPGTTSPTRMYSKDEKRLLSGLTDEIDEDMLKILKSPSFLHKKRPEYEAKKLQKRWLDLLEERIQKETNDIGKAKSKTASHLLLLRTLGKTCQIKVYDVLLNKIADFFQSVISEILCGSLSARKVADNTLKDLRRHQNRQTTIIISHINRQQLQKHKKMVKDHIQAWYTETVGKKKQMKNLQKVC
jgi:hypothetical protein